MEDLLIETLSQLGFPVKLQGSLLEDEIYPEHFFTFWNSDSSSDGYYDNKEGVIIYEYDVNFYSVNPEYVYLKLREAKHLLLNAGFIVSGDGHSVPSGEPSHDGRGIEVKYMEASNGKTIF